MSDWGLYPFHVNDGTEATYSLFEPDQFQQYFSLPDDVVEALMHWDDVRQALMDWDDPGSTRWPTEDDRQQWIELGRAAARTLRSHLPADVELRYAAAGEILTENY